MSETDPETEALIRQIHREVNGLTRPRRSAGPPGQPRSDEKDRSRPSGTASRPNSSGGRRKLEPGSGSQGDQQPSSDGQKQRSNLKRLRKHGDGERQGNEGSCEIEEQVSTLQAEPRGSAHQDERAAQQEVSGQDGRSEERFIAVASTAAADGRQRAQHSEADPPPSRIKCFYAGVRWGLTLPPEALSSRTSLASSLSAAYGKDGLPCSRGDRLHVVFLDKDGKSSEFPPHTEAGWGTAAKFASRVYVRLG
ncbi:hypothetical protein WJX75_001072 [Coccomyxa subellipsoidea]|uniref:Uncharacterized protein n=1 Tax=Coccomyxa subellipsoidea TaxID=248742 RepID=A0ABR2YUV2_9CHLO